MIGDPIITLELKEPRARTALPASAFPEWAEVYLCDNCGRDVTRFFCARQSHSWVPMAPERFACACGRPYLTGAIEWDNLADRERQRRLTNGLGLGFFLSLLSSVPGIGVYFILRIWSWRLAATAGLMMALTPFLLVNVPFWCEIAASMWRTRVRG